MGKRHLVFIALLAGTALAKPLSDVEVAKRLKTAREEVDRGYLDRAADTLDRLLAANPGETAAVPMLCDVRTAIADDLELDPVPHTEIVAAFAKAATACRAAAKIERAPSFWARRAWAHDALRAESTVNLREAYQAWAEAEPDDPRAIGGLAAVLKVLGHAEDAQTVLDHAVAGSAAFGQRVRFEYLCKVTAQETRDPLLEQMLASEESPEGKTMLAVMQMQLRDPRESLLTFLDAIEKGTLSETNAHKLWNCLAGENYFTRDDRKIQPPPGMTLPERVRTVLAPYPATNRGEGKAIVAMRIEADGRAGTMWLVRASERPFGDAALVSAARSTYRPGTLGGVAVPFPRVFAFTYKQARPKR